MRGAEINTVTEVSEDGTTRQVDVSKEDPASVEDKLESGKYMISLGDFLYQNNTDAEIELSDFEITADTLSVESGLDSR